MRGWKNTNNKMRSPKMNKSEPTRGAPPKRGATASAVINVRVDADRKNHYTRFAKKRRTGDKTLAGLVIETLDAATGYREGANA